MCGIVGAIAQRNITTILVDGLKHLEYRGYDSAGIAVVDRAGQLQRRRMTGKVNELEQALVEDPVSGTIGIAHTRWATHGEPLLHNAHPHLSSDQIAVVHNGIIENHETLRDKLKDMGYQFDSDTDSEIVAHLLHHHIDQGKDLLQATMETSRELEGAYALGIIDKSDPDRMIAIRQDSPLVIGLGYDENFIASDQLALQNIAQRIIYLEEGDIAEITHDKINITDRKGKTTQRKPVQQDKNHTRSNKGGFRHYMLKEIFEQPEAIAATMAGHISHKHVFEQMLGEKAPKIFDRVKKIQISACGTSYHAGMIARYWFEELGGIPCQVEIASELRYRKTVVDKDTLFIAISQSGETADTLAAMRQAKELGYLARLAICNVPSSSLAREADFVFMTRAGAEIGVASTKAFTTQLTALLMLTIVFGRHHQLTAETERELVSQLRQLPDIIKKILTLSDSIADLAERFADKENALFLGRGLQYPVALEGALKLKEISYIHAEAYPAGELKHGPLALVDKDMPVIAVAPNDELLEKLKSNLQEVKARGGELFVFADHSAHLENTPGITTIEIASVDKMISPIIYTIPLQLLAYHVAVLKGTDIDQPRNLAKSVTVE